MGQIIDQGGEKLQLRKMKLPLPVGHAHTAAVNNISTFFSALSTVSGRLMSKHKSTASESL